MNQQIRNYLQIRNYYLFATNVLRKAKVDVQILVNNDLKIAKVHEPVYGPYGAF